jgi:DNA primase
MQDLLGIIGTDVRLKRATKRTGQWSGPCPKCRGEDRFCVWPERNRFWCRVCDWKGDGIDYLRETRGLSFVEARAMMGGELPTPEKRKPAAAPAPTYRTAEPPPAEWQTQARQVIDTCCASLWSTAGERALAWLAKRGLEGETLRSWHVGFNPRPQEIAGLFVDQGIVIPCLDASQVWYLNVRRRDGLQPKYKKVSGSRAALFGVDHLTGKPDLFTVEGEFDAMLLWQEAGHLADVLTLGGASGRLADDHMVYLLGADRFHVATDSDEEGDKAADEWLGLLGRRGRRILPPGSCKDVSEAHQNGAILEGWAVDAIWTMARGMPMPEMFQPAESEEAYWAAIAAEDEAPALAEVAG